MNQVFHFIKLAAAVVLVVAGTVFLAISHPLALPCFVGGLAWSHLPE